MVVAMRVVGAADHWHGRNVMACPRSRQPADEAAEAAMVTRVTGVVRLADAA